MSNIIDKEQREFIQKHTNMPEALFTAMLSVFNKLCPATISVKRCDQSGNTAFHIPDCKRTYFALQVNDGLLDETYRILMFHEFWFELCRSLYHEKLIGVELANIFLALKAFDYGYLIKKLNIDYGKFRDGTVF
jgi:hypothetical protein